MLLAKQHKGLETMVNTAVDMIRKASYSKAAHSRSPEEMEMRLVSANGMKWTSPKEQRVIELEETDLRENLKSSQDLPAGSIRGVYIASKGKIVLVRDCWCLKTVIHETLHSTSITGQRIDLLKRYYGFFDGLTEFQAGYVLFKHHKECYESWKENKYDICSFCSLRSYYIRLFGAICHFVSIHHLAMVYFWQGHTRWEESFHDFVSLIRKAGYPRFRNVLKFKNNFPLHVNLAQECIDSFGAKFEGIYGSKSQSLDFAAMKIY